MLKKELEKIIQMARKDEVVEILPEIFKRCERHRSENMRSWLEQNLHPEVKSVLPDEVEAMIKEYEDSLKEKSNKIDIPMLLSDPDALAVLANQIVKGEFTKVDIKGTPVAKFINKKLKMVEILYKDDVKDIIESFIYNKFYEIYQQKAGSVLPKVLYSIFVLESGREELVNHTTKSAEEDPRICLFRSTLSPTNGKLDSWMQWLDRLSDKEAFCAWIWGVYSGEYKGRQNLWLSGPGASGKSCALNVLATNLFGSTYKSINVHNKNQFTTSIYENARLIGYLDANNSKVLHSELFKSLSSGGADKVTIEKKGKDAYHAYLNTYTFVLSNRVPYLTADEHITSRLLYIEVLPNPNKIDPGITNKLTNEIEAFLFFAKSCYEKLIDDKHYEIATSSVTNELEKKLIELSESEWTDTVDANWEVTGNNADYVSASEVQNALISVGISNTQEIRRFHDFLKSNYKVTKTRKRIRGVPRTVFVGMKYRDCSVNSILTKASKDCADAEIPIKEENILKGVFENEE